MPNRKSLYRAMEILPLLLVVVLVFSAICLANSKEIVLRYDGQEKVVTTILEDPRSILEESGVKVGKEDRILISPANAEKKTREVIELKRALPVTIEKYGVSKNSIPVKQLSARRLMPWRSIMKAKQSILLLIRRSLPTWRSIF